MRAQSGCSADASTAGLAADAPTAGTTADNSVAGFVAGEPVPRRLVDERIAELRGGVLAGALPAPGSAEDRQLARWVAQVVLTEQICVAEARRLRLPTDGAPGEHLDGRTAVELGSITAAAYAASAAVRTVYAAITADVEVPEAEVRRLFRYRAPALARPRRWVLRHGVFDTADAARSADPARLPLLGEVTADTLPVALAAALTGRQPGDAVGPVRDPLGWHLAYVEAVLPAAEPDYAAAAPALRAELRAAAGRRVFAHWLERRRADLVVLVPGLEHPADPNQPDHRHRH